MIDNINNNNKNNKNDEMIHVDEFIRRQEILQPKIEKLVSQIPQTENDKLYSFYDPLHPPTDEELVDKLQKWIDDVKQKQEKLL